MGARRMAKGIGEFLMELVGEAVAEVILGLLACALLLSLGLIAYLSWSFSPRLTVAGAGGLSLFLAYGAWGAFRNPSKDSRRRGVAAVATGGFTLAAATAVFLFFYGSDCGCL